MIKSEIQIEIQKAKKKLVEYRRKKINVKHLIKDAEDIIGKLEKSKIQTEQNINSIISELTKKASRLSPYSKLRDDYINNAKSILRGNNSSQGIEKLNDSIRKTKNKLLEFEDDLDFYNSKINYYEQKIEDLKKELRNL